jgi:hypothetical protein
MTVKRIDEFTVAYDISNITATVRTSDQYVTVYCNDHIVGTMRRRRHNERHIREWTIYDVEGNELGNFGYVASCIHELRRNLVCDI